MRHAQAHGRCLGVICSQLLAQKLHLACKAGTRPSIRRKRLHPGPWDERRPLFGDSHWQSPGEYRREGPAGECREKGSMVPFPLHPHQTSPGLPLSRAFHYQCVCIFCCVMIEVLAQLF
jgi:hypothetical protein